VSGKTLPEIDSDYHLRRIVELLTVAVLGVAAIPPESNPIPEEKHILYLFVKEYLSHLDQARLKEDINSVKNFSDRAKDIWNSFTGPVGVILNAFLARFGMGKAEVDKINEQKSRLGPYKAQLEMLAKLAYRLGYHSIYVLIDRVDETPLTTNLRDETASFILPLISDLHLLELPGFAFKFFLWDLLREDYQKKGRPDRVKFYSLEWSYQQLAGILSERLKAYSGGKIVSLQQISGEQYSRSLDDVVAIFAQGSPRNVVRICKEILDQQSEIDPGATKLSPEAITLGFERIASNVTAETFNSRLIKDLQQTRRCQFTIRTLASEVFRISPTAATNKLRSWENAGAVMQLGQITEQKGNKPSYLYGMSNMFLAKHVFARMPIKEFVDAKIRVCSSCRAVMLRDWDIRSENQCHSCSTHLTR